MDVQVKDGSIAMHFVRASLEPVVEQGGNVEALLHGAGIDPGLLHAPGARVLPQHFSALWLAVARLLDDELFGQDARRMKVGSFAMLCQSLIHSSTLGGAMHRMARLFNLLLDDFQCTVLFDDRTASLQIDHAPGRRTSAAFGTETLLTMQQGLACWLVGRRIPVVAAQFRYPPPCCRDEYASMFSPQVSFEQPATRLLIDRSLMSLPVIQNRKSLAKFVHEAPGNILMKYRNSDGPAAQIRRRLRAVAFSSWPSFEGVADSFNMAPSTLRRRLQDEGQSFQGIKDQVRRDIAIDWLCHSTDSVGAIAWQLGFSEASAFHRAFKKWTGANPGEYRERVLRQMAYTGA